jgi:hypothetical protein
MKKNLYISYVFDDYLKTFKLLEVLSPSYYFIKLNYNYLLILSFIFLIEELNRNLFLNQVIVLYFFVFICLVIVSLLH